MTKKIEVFASEALPGELEVFPDIKRGWGTTKETTGGIPPMKWFNAIQKRTDEAINAIAEGSISGYTFKDGATLDSHKDFIYDDVSKSWYFWIGGSGKVIPPNSNASEVIESDGGIWSETNPNGLWVNVVDASLRGDLNSSNGANLVKTSSGESVQDLLDFTVPASTSALSLLPQSIISTTNGTMAIEVINSDPTLGEGQIRTYRKTKSGWWLRENIITGDYSGGDSLPNNNCPVWRLGDAFICTHLLTLKQTLTDSSAGIQQYDFTPDQFKDGDNKNKVKFYLITGEAGGYIEFTTDTKSSDINILFAATANTTRTMDIEFYDDGILIDSTTINTVGKSESGQFNTYVTSVKNPRPGSELTVKISKSESKYAYVAGINANFDTTVSDDIDKIYWSIFNTSSGKLIRSNLTGAMCYVFKELTSNVFGGESHGGETPTLQKFIIDNAETTLTTGSAFSCESFCVIQETQIKWSETKKIDCFTEHRFNADGTHEFIGTFNPSDGFETNSAFCPMFSVDSEYFRRLTFPKSINMIDYPHGSTVTFEHPVNKFEIQTKDSAYTAGIMWSSSLKNNGNSNLYVKPYGVYSTKFYAGPAIGKRVTLEPFSIHQFRYYF